MTSLQNSAQPQMDFFYFPSNHQPLHHLGEYSCPYTGYYLFSVTVMTNPNHHTSTMLYKKNPDGVETAFVAAFADTGVSII